MARREVPQVKSQPQSVISSRHCRFLRFLNRKTPLKLTSRKHRDSGTELVSFPGSLGDSNPHAVETPESKMVTLLEPTLASLLVGKEMVKRTVRLG